MIKVEESIRQVVLKCIDESQEVLLKIVDEKIASELTDCYFTRKQAAEYLNCSLGTIDNLVRRGLKKYFIMSSPRFKKSEIDEFIANSNGP